MPKFEVLAVLQDSLQESVLQCPHKFEVLAVLQDSLQESVLQCPHL